MMVVSELIELLKTFPPGMPVAYECCSEQVCMRADQIYVADLSIPRKDDWVHDKRPDVPSQKYLVFPGN